MKANNQQQTTSDYLIVGAGLAGCLLAWRLEQAGKSVQLIGDCAAPSASAVAAGVINPVTGRWAVKSWEFDTLGPEAERCYRAIEQTFDVELYHKIPLHRYCQNDEDVKRIGRRMRNPRYSNVLGDFHEVGSGPEAIKDTLGYFDILGAAYVDLPLLLKTLRGHFTQQCRLDDTSFHYTDLKQGESSYHYGAITAQHVIFCEGANLRNNPWFNWLPLAPIKGETLIVKCPSLELPKAIYHHQKWILPYDDQTIRLGATYEVDDLSCEPTEDGKQQLLDGLYSFISETHQVEIVQHLAGLRPSSADVRPFLGSHHEKPNLHILNGLGSKGASLAPEMSRQFVAHLLEGTELDDEINISRFR